jgi:predicted GTPase
VPIVPISAVTKAGVTTLMDRVLDIYSENRKVVDKHVLRTLTRNLQAPPGGELLHLKQVGSKPPLFNATVTTSVKENYIKYVRHSIRHYFGFSGVPLLIKTRVVKKRHFR